MPITFGRAGWLTKWATDTPVQAGVAAASWSVAGSFARGLLPRSPRQQAVATGIVAAAHYQLGATAWATLQAVGSWPGTRPGVRANLILAGSGIAAGLATSAIAERYSERSMVAAGALVASSTTCGL